MADANPVDLQIGDLIQSLQNKGFEGAKYAIIIITETLRVFFRIMNTCIQHLGFTVVRAQKVAGEERLRLGPIGEHRVRPVKHGSDDKFQRADPRFQLVSCIHHTAIERRIAKILQEFMPGGTAEDLDIRIDRKQLLDAATMVRLGVVGNKVIDIANISYTVDVFAEFIEKGLVTSIDQHILLPRDQKGVVARAVFRCHNDVKNPQGRVQRPHAVEIFR